MKNILAKLMAALLCLTLFNTMVRASTDYPPAIYNEAYKNHWYNTGSGHRFVVIHDMEGFYLAVISYFKQQSTSASAHYCINGKKDTTSDSPAGEVTQMVREKHYAWHALCWNRYSFGTEHEGFAGNPAWYTDAQYEASALLQRHLCDVWGIPKDRNHVVGHNEWQNPAWVSWAGSGLGIDPTCNTHTDPGPFWDWEFFMKLIKGGPYNRSATAGVVAPSTVDVGATFSASITMTNNGTTVWTSGAYALGSQNPQDNTIWGFSRVALPVSQVNTGAVVTFDFTATAPITPGNYAFDWRMVQEGVEWFGHTAAKPITVGNWPADTIIDNPAATIVGTWSSGTSAADKFGSDYRFHSQGTGSAYLQYTPNIQTAGNYQVYEWHSIGTNRTLGAPHVVTYNGGTITVNVNQKINGGRWNLIGTFNFATGTAGNVKITDGFADSGQVVMADAIKFVYTGP